MDEGERKTENNWGEPTESMIFYYSVCTVFTLRKEVFLYVWKELFKRHDCLKEKERWLQSLNLHVLQLWRLDFKGANHFFWLGSCHTAVTQTTIRTNSSCGVSHKTERALILFIHSLNMEYCLWLIKNEKKISYHHIFFLNYLLLFPPFYSKCISVFHQKNLHFYYNVQLLMEEVSNF